MMIDAYHDLINDLTETPRRLQALVAETEPQATRSNEAWGPAEIVAHMVDTERLSRGRIQLILTKETPVLHRFDPTASARERDYAATNLQQSVQDFGVERGETITLLLNLALKDWERFGIHDEFGELTIEDVVEQLIDHDAEHLAQIPKSSS